MTASGHKTALIVPLTHPSAGAMRAGMDAAAAAGADMVECRLDYLDAPARDAPAVLLAGPPLPVVATCRPTRQGGRFDGPETDRLAVLRAAAESGADYVDVEDDVPEPRWPEGPVIVSHHDFARRPGDLDGLVARMSRTRAEVVKVAFAAAGPADALGALEVVIGAAKPAIALAMGEAGAVSRILAKKFGAFGTYASLAAGAESAPGQLTIDEMKRLYRWDALGAGTDVYGVIGCPVAHSMSPAIHNAAFAEAGLDAVYVPLRIAPGADNFDRFLAAARAADWLGLRGLSVTIPHKANALAAAGDANVDDLARRIGAINTLRIGPDGALSGWNTDYAAAIDALAAAMGTAREGLAGRRVAVVGAGGAARAIVAALAHYGAAVSIYNRTVSRARQLAAEFGADAAGLDGLARLDAEIVVNCTSVGMHPHVADSPVPAEVLGTVRAVFDTVYNPIETRLLREARAAGALCVSGLEMFVNQAAGQFEIWTGRAAPRDLMRRVVIRHLEEFSQ